MSTAQLQTVRTVQGDTLSAVLWRHAGSSQGIEQVLDANPQLAHLPAVLPAGVEVHLPTQQRAAAIAPSLSLWE